MTTTPDFGAIIQEAHDAASAASRRYVAENGEHPFNCGFAWVTVDGVSPLARFCRKQIKEREALRDKGQIGPRAVTEAQTHFGCKGYPSGHQFWGPGDYMGQDMSAKRAGAEAFARVLADKLGYNATVGSRLD